MKGIVVPPNGIINKIINLLTDATTGKKFKFGIDSNGNYGYIKDGADTVTPFRQIQTGSVTVSVAPETWRSTTVTFPMAFSTAPTVRFDYEAGTNGCSVYVRNVTASNCIFSYNNFFTSSTKTIIISWVAYI